MNQEQIDTVIKIMSRYVGIHYTAQFTPEEYMLKIMSETATYVFITGPSVNDVRFDYRYGWRNDCLTLSEQDRVNDIVSELKRIVIAKTITHSNNPLPPKTSHYKQLTRINTTLLWIGLLSLATSVWIIVFNAGQEKWLFIGSFIGVIITICIDQWLDFKIEKHNEMILENKKYLNSVYGKLSNINYGKLSNSDVEIKTYVLMKKDRISDEWEYEDSSNSYTHLLRKINWYVETTLLTHANFKIITKSEETK